MSARLEPLEVRRLLSTIAGTVFDDADSSGTFDVGETGIENRTVYLDDDNDGTKDAGETSVLTASDGTYIFLGLSAGTYHVRQVVPFGFDQTIPTGDDGYDIFLVDGQDVENTDFGTVAVPVITGSIAGTVYDDADGDGTLDVGELGASGRTVYLDTDNDGTLDGDETFTTTDVDGTYMFDLLEIKAYKVRTVLPDNTWRQTLPASNAALTVTLTDGSRDQTGKDFLTTNKAIGTFSGTVFNDKNRNGVKDSGENGLSGIVVFLDTNDNGVADVGELTRTTNGSGAYSFANIDAGDYIVRQTLQTNWVQTLPVGNGTARNVTIARDDNLTGEDFGQDAIPGRILGTVFDDFDSDGVRDTGEPGLSGFQVFIDTDKDGNLDTGETTVLTDKNGNYRFVNIDPGSYRVRVVLKNGYRFTTASFIDTTLAAAQDVTGQLFGLSNRSTISGSVFSDANTSRTRDVGEVGLRGWKIYIDANNNARFDAGESFVTTDANGDFSFKNFVAGTYIIRAVQQSKYKLTTPKVGYYTANLTSSASTTGLLFGQKLV